MINEITEINLFLSSVPSSSEFDFITVPSQINAVADQALVNSQPAQNQVQKKSFSLVRKTEGGRDKARNDWKKFVKIHAMVPKNEEIWNIDQEELLIASVKKFYSINKRINWDSIQSIFNDKSTIWRDTKKITSYYNNTILKGKGLVQLDINGLPKLHVKTYCQNQKLIQCVNSQFPTQLPAKAP